MFHVKLAAIADGIVARGFGTVPPDEVRARHIDDALSAIALIDRLVPAGPIVDIGSGAGIPGLVLAAAFPDRRVTLIESNARRAVGLGELAAEAGVDNIDVIASRAEEAARGAARDAFALAVCRALAPLPVAAELCLPFVTPGGHWIAYAGAVEREPVERACRALAAEVVAVEHVAGSDRRHHVAAVKLGPTPERFPRRPGVAARRPLA